MIEVVCGVQFETVAALASVHFGEFWQHVKEEYPLAEDKPPIADLFEDRKVTEGKAELLIEMPPLRRVFYIDRSENYLLQLQPSRFLANWRRVRDDDAYPRFTAAHGRFLKGWEAFLRFIKDKGWASPQTNQYELTYINHIFPVQRDFPVGIEYFLPLVAWSKCRSTEFLPAPRGVAMRLRFSLPDNRGTLHVKIDHGERVDGKQVLLVDLTARGGAAKNWSDMDDWFSMAHEWIVRGFTDLTSRDAHGVWEREQ